MLEIRIEKSFKKDIQRDQKYGKYTKNDWLLIFKVDDNYLTLVMLGSHSQVYKKYK